MSERDAFERRLDAALQAFADDAPVEVDPAALTRSLAEGMPDGRRLVGLPLLRLPDSRVFRSLLAAALVVVLAAAIPLIGALRNATLFPSGGRHAPGQTLPAVVVGPSATLEMTASPLASAPAVGPSPSAAPASPAMAPAAIPTYGATLAWSGFARLPRLDPNLALPSPTMGGVTAGGPGFVAVGSDRLDATQAVAVAWTSSDGTSWQEHEIGTPVPAASLTGPALTSIGEGDGVLVAVGPEGIWTSRDGARWAEVAAPSTLGGLPARVAFGRSRFVVLGRSTSEPCRGLAWTSTDGSSWAPTSLPSPGAFCPTGLAAVGSGFVAVGEDPATGGTAILTSTDGTSWGRVPSQAAFDGSGYPEGVATTSSGWIAFGSFQPAGVGYRGVQVWASADGLAWRRAGFLRPTGPFACDPATAHMLDVAAFGPGYVAVGSCTANPELVGLAWVSANGTDWQTVLGRVRPMTAIASDGSRLVAVGSDWPGNEPIVSTALVGR